MENPVAQGFSSLQFEVDIDGIGAASAESGRERINLQHTLGGGENGFVHHDVAAGFENLHFGDFAVLFDADLQGGNKGL